MRATRIGCKIIESPPADLGQLIRRVYVRLRPRRCLGRESHRDLPFAAIGNEELRLQVPQCHLGEIKTNLLSDFASSSRLEHARQRTSEVNMAADHPDHVRRVRDPGRPDHKQPAVAAMDQDADCDRVDLGVHQ